jgi:hypothetical protein
MLTIENINIIKSKFAGTPEWRIGEMFIGEQNYIFVIHKRVGYWTIGGFRRDELTIKLNRVKAIGGYVMETGLVKQNFHGRSAWDIEYMKTMSSFIFCLDTHIKNIIK